MLYIFLSVCIVSFSLLIACFLLVFREQAKQSAVDVPTIIEQTLKWSVIEARKLDIEYERIISDRAEKRDIERTKELDLIQAQIQEVEDFDDGLPTDIYQPYAPDPADPNTFTLEQTLDLVRRLNDSGTSGNL